MKFEELDLHPKILEALEKEGYVTPTEVQQKAIPEVMQKKDLRICSQTGSGKTATFLLPAIQRLTRSGAEKGRGPRLLVLAPTRELGLQIAAQAEKYSKFLPHLKTVSISGGVPYAKHMRKLKQNYDILIATPGRLIDYLKRKVVHLGRVEMLVLDEADRMLDMGFQDDVETIINATPESRQTLLFSATLQGEVFNLSKRHMNNPTDIEIHSKHDRHENIQQKLHPVDSISHKNRLLNHLLRQDDLKYAIVFTSTKRHANELARQLNDDGHLAGALHGDMNQRQRTRTVTNLKKGKFNVLVATDVAARGLDVSTITHVINYDLPRQTEDYVHRIGRTGRAGAEGTAHSFALGKDVNLVKQIEKFTGQTISVDHIEGFEPKKNWGKPSNKGRPQNHRRSRSRRKSFRGKKAFSR